MYVCLYVHIYISIEVKSIERKLCKLLTKNIKKIGGKAVWVGITVAYPIVFNAVVNEYKKS